MASPNTMFTLRGIRPSVRTDVFDAVSGSVSSEEAESAGHIRTT
ncbi:hypothetical protein [Paenibacillus antibioticophila]|nr:hypothetical protein [Paenibacillus antibioticophila]